VSQDALREVLRSPLDDPPPGRSGWGAAALAFLVAAAVGVGGVAALRAGGTTAATQSTTTLAAVDEPVVTAPVSVGDLGVEVAAVWNQGDHLYVVVATTVLPGSDPAGVTAIPDAQWVIRLPEGDQVTATGEYTSGLVPGLFTVEFPALSASGEAQLLMYPAAAEADADFSTQRDTAQLPWEGPLDGTPYRLGDQEVVIDTVRLDDAGGEVSWHLGGGSAAHAVVTAGATYQEVGGDPQVIVPESALPFASLVSVDSPVPSAGSGLIHLFRLDDAENPSFRSRFWGDPDKVVAIQGLTVEISARVYRYAEEAAVFPIVLPDSS
jgi:hypothetical protein